MATRFFLPTDGAPAVNPAFGAWDGTSPSDVARLRCPTVQGSTVTIGQTYFTGTANQNFLMRQYISDSLQAQTISGTIKSIVRANEGVATADCMPQLLVRVVSNNGLIFRSPNLIDFNNTALSNEFTSGSAQNRKFPRNWAGAGETVNTVTTEAGDRVVFEFGYRQAASVASAQLMVFGDLPITPLAENETDTIDNYPWIELSANLLFGDLAAIELLRPIGGRGATW